MSIGKNLKSNELHKQGIGSRSGFMSKRFSGIADKAVKLKLISEFEIVQRHNSIPKRNQTERFDAKGSITISVGKR